jgi:hypothetical protein
MWMRTTNELGVNGANDEHENQEGRNPRGKTIKKDKSCFKKFKQVSKHVNQTWHVSKHLSLPNIF